MVNFWKALPSPFFVLAPMEDVTDVVFREVVATVLPRPHVFFTEFTSSDGLCSKGFEKVALKLKYSEGQRPIVAQIWGNNPEKMEKAAHIVQELGFDGLDINMGCPERGLVRKGMCSGLINFPDVAVSLIQAVKRGANNIPISVKTRIGTNKIVTDEWIPLLLKQNVQALTIHGRTASQMSEGLANWGEIAKGVKFRDELSPDTVIIGNGDVKSYGEGISKTKEFGVDGIMIGRGIFHNPWVFSKEEKEHTPQEKLQVMLKHFELFDKTWGKTKNFEIMKKFVKMYVNNYDGASEVRQLLMECKNLAQIQEKVMGLQS